MRKLLKSCFSYLHTYHLLLYRQLPSSTVMRFYCLNISHYSDNLVRRSSFSASFSKTPAGIEKWRALLPRHGISPLIKFASKTNLQRTIYLSWHALIALTFRNRCCLLETPYNKSKRSEEHTS